MSKGNSPSEGNKGRNMPFQLSSLQGLQQIANNTYGIIGQLISILNATKAHQDMEILLVRDTGNGDLIVQQIREYDETTNTWSTTYTDISGAPYVPIGPLEYMDASAVLNLILTELLDQGTTLDSIDDGTAAALGQTVMASSVPVVIASNQTALPVTFPTGANTLGYVRTVGVAAVVIAAGAKKVSIMNIGPDDITVDVGAGAVILDAGISLPFEAQEGKTLPAITLTGSTASSKHLYTSVI